MNHSFRLFRCPATASLIALSLGITTAASAAPDNYTNSAATSSWNLSTNWSTGTVAGAGDTAIFNSPVNTAAETITLDANQAAFGIQTVATEGTVTLSSTSATPNGAYTLTLGTGGMSNSGTGDIVMYANVVLNGDQAWTGGAGNVYQLKNALSGTGNVTISRINSLGDLLGSVTGTATLTGQSDVTGNFLNTFSGGVTISAGTVGLRDAAVVTKNVTFTTGTNWYTNGYNASFSGSVVGPGTIQNIGSGNLTFSGATDNTSLSVNTPGGTTFLAKTSGSSVHAIGGKLEVTNGSTAQITGTGGDQIVDTGTLQIDTGSTFDLNGNNETINLLNGTGGVVTNTATGTTSTLTISANNGTDTFNGILQDGAGVTAFTKTGTGTETLTKANTFSGGTAVNGGTLALDFTASAPTSILNNAGALSLGGGTLSIKGTATGFTSQTVSGLTLNAGASAITLNGNGGSGTSLTLNAITRNAGSTINFTLPATTSVTTTTANANFSGGQQTILGGYATVAGAGWAVSGTGGTPGAISTLGTYNSGFAAGKDVDVASGTSTPAAMTVNSVRFNSANLATVNTSGNLVIATGGILVTPTVAANATSINNNTITSGNGQGLIVNQYSPSGTLTIKSGIVNNGGTSIGLTKSGTGALTLSGSNTYTGATYLNGGTTTVTNASTLGSGSAVSVKGGTLAFSNDGGQIDLVGIGATATASSGNASAPLAIDNDPSLNTRWESAQSDPQWLKIDLKGNYTIASAQISFETAGAKDFVLQTGTAAATGNPDGTGTGGYTTVKTVTGQTSYNDKHYVTYALTPSTGQYFDLYGTARNTGYGYSIFDLKLFTASGAYSQTIGSLSGDATSSVTLASQLSLTTGGDNSSTTFAGVISGTGNLIKTGSGTMTLTNANTFTGSATVNGGTLAASGSNTLKALGTITQLTLNKTGTLLLGAKNQIAIATPVTIGGGVGTATLNTGGYSQTTDARLGALTLAGTGAIDFSTNATANGNSIVAFADSSAIAWSGTLSIYNYAGSTTGGGTDQLIFGTGSSALTSTQLGEIAFYSGGAGSSFLGYGTFVGASGEVTYAGAAVPEPATVFAGLMMVGAAGWSQRRRLGAFAGARRG